MSGMLTRILTTILFHSRGPEVRRPAGEFRPGGDTRRLLRVSQRGCRTGCQASRESRRPAVRRLGPNMPEPPPARPPRPSRRPLASPASAERPAAATSQCGGPAAATLLTRRRDESRCNRFLRTHPSRALKAVAQPGASPRAARAFPSARGRRYFQRSGVSGLDATSSV